jgi:Flp pilus assembly protein TadD
MISASVASLANLLPDGTRAGGSIMSRIQGESADRIEVNNTTSSGNDADRADVLSNETMLDGSDPIATDRDQRMRLALQGRFADAEACAREALRPLPEEIDRHNALAIAFWRQGRPAEAEEIFRRAISRSPSAAYLWTNLGLFQAEQDRKADATESFRTAIRLQPGDFSARMNLGIALSDQGKFDEAAHWLESALEVQPDSAEALQNVGMNLARQRRWAEAVDYYERAVQIQPDNPDPHMTFACVLIGAGDYARGWPAYEWRLKRRENKGARVNLTFWNGDDFREQTILLHFEQGLGDTLQFVRFAPMVKRRGGRVVLLCQTALVRLLSRCPGVDLAYDGTSYEPPCHIHASLMSLPSIFGTTLATLPAKVPYDFAESALVEHWRSQLVKALSQEGEDLQLAPIASGHRTPNRPFLVGIAWQGHPDHSGDHWRSFRVDQFSPLAQVPGIRLISLQVGAGRDQVEALSGRFAVTDLPGRRGRDFSETAAIMCSLDLIITPDSALAHLAGALGLPVWVALCYSSEWRWLSGGDDSPWYPTMRLFQQAKPGEWEPVFERMAEGLRGDLCRRGRSHHDEAAYVTTGLKS